MQGGLVRKKLSVRPSVCLFVCLSARLSVCQMRALWQNGRKICPDFYTVRKIISLVFWEEECVGATPSTWNFGSTGPRWSEIADFEPIFACIASAVTPRLFFNEGFPFFVFFISKTSLMCWLHLLCLVAWNYRAVGADLSLSGCINLPCRSSPTGLASCSSSITIDQSSSSQDLLRRSSPVREGMDGRTGICSRGNTVANPCCGSIHCAMLAGFHFTDAINE